MKQVLLSFLLTLLPVVASADEVEVNGVRYYLQTYSNNAQVVSIPNKYSGNVEILPSIKSGDETYPVTEISDFAFEDCTGLTSVIIPNSVVKIGYGAFQGCSGLTTVTIPNSVNSIEDHAFDNCSGLTTLAIPNSVTYILTSVFSGCSSLTSVSIPSSVTFIGLEAFSGCSSLTSVTIPHSVTSIVSGAFSGCSSLTSITIPQSVSSIDTRTFEGCSALSTIVVEEGNTKYDSRNNCNGIIETETNKLIVGCKNTTIPNSVTSIDYFAFSGCSELTSISIPSSVTEIGSNAFSGCSSLTSIVIPNNVKIIGEHTFYGCGLTSITIPNSVSFIEHSAFEACSALSTIVVEEGNSKYDSRNNCNGIIETESNKLIIGIKNTIIPEGVLSIGPNAFYNCTELTSITIPNSVTEIGHWAFNSCRGLKNITIPNNVSFIGSNAFGSCTGLTSITIPSSVTNIVESAFQGCNNLLSVTSDIEEPFNINSNNFSEETYRKGTLYVPKGTKELYSRFDGWRQFLKIEEKPAEIAGLEKCARPVITISNGNIIFKCATEGAKIKYEYTTKGEVDNNGSLIAGKMSIIITATATADGYNPSDTAAASFSLSDLINGDVNGDGEVNVADHVELSKIILNQ